jgi:hypothetical protein
MNCRGYPKPPLLPWAGALVLAGLSEEGRFTAAGARAIAAVLTRPMPGARRVLSSGTVPLTEPEAAAGQ